VKNSNHLSFHSSPSDFTCPFLGFGVFDLERGLLPDAGGVEQAQSNENALSQDQQVAG
jgi:hypothetical protein